jgi:hypothetical protein
MEERGNKKHESPREGAEVFIVCGPRLLIFASQLAGVCFEATCERSCPHSCWISTAATITSSKFPFSEKIWRSSRSVLRTTALIDSPGHCTHKLRRVTRIEIKYFRDIDTNVIYLIKSQRVLNAPALHAFVFQDKVLNMISSVFNLLFPRYPSSWRKYYSPAKLAVFQIHTVS